MAMYPANGNGFAPHDLYLNGNGYQQPLPHAVPLPPGAPMDPYQHYQTHPVMHHPPHTHQSTTDYQSHQQPPPQHVKPEPVDGDQLKSPMSVSNVEPGTTRRFRLDVMQQPERARMCGHGDKDRRPITPPPCIRLVITHTETGEEVNYNEIDFLKYVIQVHLWDKDARVETNLCRQPPSSTAGNVPTTPSYPYGHMNSGESTQLRYAPQPDAAGREMGYTQPVPAYMPDYGQQLPSGYGAVTPTIPPGYTYGPPTHIEPPSHIVPSQRWDPPMMCAEGNANGSSYPSNGCKVVYTSRNLIGGTVGTAALLTEPEPSQREGIFFVLQDLSVRLEGDYCLKFTFVNVAEMSRAPNGRVPLLASCFSTPFKVYSAKRFPGVHESTPLSKAFAEQGVKIPIRKTGEDGREGRGGSKNDDEDVDNV